MGLFNTGSGLFQSESDIGINKNQIDNKTTIILRKGSNQSIPTGTETAVTFGVVESTTDPNTFTIGDSKIYIKKDGVYLAAASVGFDNNATGYRRAQLIAKKGLASTLMAIFSGAVDNGTVNPDLSLTGAKFIEAGSYIYLSANQTSGGNLDVKGGTRLVIYQLKEGLY